MHVFLSYVGLSVFSFLRGGGCGERECSGITNPVLVSRLNLSQHYVCYIELKKGAVEI